MDGVIASVSAKRAGSVNLVATHASRKLNYRKCMTYAEQNTVNTHKMENLHEWGMGMQRKANCVLFLSS
jgi:hypothetical protein